MQWEEVFVFSTSFWELFARGTIIYLAVVVLMRAAGRRESGELTTTDLILVVVISEAASVGISGEAHSIFDSLILVATILAWSILLDAIAYRWPWAAKLLKPRPKPLIMRGEINRNTARREFLTKEEILSQLRQQGIDDISQVVEAYVEPNGHISIVSQR